MLGGVVPLLIVLCAAALPAFGLVSRFRFRQQNCKGGVPMILTVITLMRMTQVA